jgi:AcrR family transcriptional regulator
MTPTQRLTPALRRTHILDAAVLLASSGNYTQITRQEIADVAGIAPTLISHHFGTMIQLRRALMRYAVQGRHLSVIAQGLAARDPQAQKATTELQASALGSLLGGE